MTGKLYLVPTPIGNLEDITLRALRILKEVDLILAEDTRTSSVLLKHYEIATHMESHHKFNEHKTSQAVCEKIAAGMNVALISDAGSPGISDPGFFLTRACIEAGIEVEALPGATAFVPALTKSGFPTSTFTFHGFLPVKKGRQTKMMELAECQHTSIVYESPFRLVRTLEQIVQFMGAQRGVAVCRELTKKFEECRRGQAQEVLNWYKNNQPKGEIAIIIAAKDYKWGEDNYEQAEEE